MIEIKCNDGGLSADFFRNREWLATVYKEYGNFDCNEHCGWSYHEKLLVALYRNVSHDAGKLLTHKEFVAHINGLISSL